MPWFEAKETIQLAPNQVVHQGDRFKYPYHAGKALVSASRAEWSTEPTAGELEEEQTAEPEPEPEPDPTPIESVDFTEVDGIGGETAADIEAWLDEEGVETVDELLGGDLTDLPGVGPSTAEDIEAHLRE